jgi:hypothetical protein
VLDTPPGESEKLSWLYVVIAVVIIYSTIPLAASLREVLRDHVGLQYLLYAGFALVLLGVFLGIRNVHRRGLPLNARVCLLAIFAVYLAYVYALREIPEEAIHVGEYGVLGLLVYRALTHRMRDFGIYLAASLVVAMIGVVDEYIQWLVPSRVFDLRDIRTNFIAGALAQLAIVAGLRPTIIRGLPTAQSWRRLCYLCIGTVALLALGFMNTPQRIAWYAGKLPPLAYLMDSKSMMVEYGYRYDDPDTGVFRSRFSRAQLEQLDRRRGAEVAEILDRYIRGIGYREFQITYSVPRDAYVHEAGVHLFRREFHLDRARENNDKRGEHYQVAYRENRILKKYFNVAMKNSMHDWEQETAMEVDSNTDKTVSYESSVSAGLITRLSQFQVVSLFVGMIALLGLIAVRLGRAGIDRT